MKRYVMKSEAGKGWRVWNNQQKKWWGNWLPSQPIELVAELNGLKRPEVIVTLTQKYQHSNRTNYPKG